MKKPPVRALDFMNAICCLLVILIHVLSLGISTADPTSWQAFFVYIPWRLSSFVVPAFLFVGGVKLALSGGHGSYRHYITARIKGVYLPYLLWTVVYYLSYIPVGYASGSWDELFHYLITGTVTSPFYYIIITMQFYLLRPLWLWMLRRVHWFVAVLTAIPVTLFCAQGNGLLSLFGIQFPYLDRIFLSYLVFWVAGLYVGKHYIAIRETLLAHKTAIFAMSPLVVGGALLPYLSYRSGLYPYPLDYYKLFVDGMAISILLVSCLLLEGCLPKLQKILLWIHRASFFVYLSHCLFLFHCTLRAQEAGITRLTPLLLCRGLVCYTMPFALYYLWSLIASRLRPSPPS